MKTKTRSEAKTINVSYDTLIKQALSNHGTMAKCFSLFRNYSLLNTLWVSRQQIARWGTINPIKGYKAWQDLNRQVKEGEEGLAVLFPVFGYFPKTDENGEVVKDAKGKVVFVKYCKGFTEKHIHFASNQTTVIDESKEVEVQKNDLQFNWELACQELGIKIVPYNDLNGNCQGWAIPTKKELAINPIASHPNKTAVHEIAHCLMHGEGCELPRELREVQAETVTYIICSMLGMSEETLSDSRGYIQRWLKDNELDEKLSKEIINTANKILEAGTGKKKRED